MSEPPAPEPPPSSGVPPPPSDRQTTRTNLDGVRRLAPGALVAGRYRIAGIVGVGGMGIVYRARDEELEVDVALKVLRPEIAPEPGLRERFRKEILLARQVSHRNVVRIHDLGQDGDLHFLTMDYVPGRSLREILEHEGRLAPPRAESIFRQLAAALAAAHAVGVVHRDLKPANVLVDDADHARVSDFGVARSLAGGGLTQAGAVVGTPDYLSPEQARGEEVDGRSDLYALGILLFEMLSGELPFAGGSYSEMIAQRLAGTPRDLRDVGVEAPPRLRAVLRRCLERSPARRYQRAEEILADLDAGPAPRWRAPLRWTAAAAAIVVALALGWWAVERRAALLQRSAPAAGAAATAAARPRHSVAVLPLVDESGRQELGWAAGGVAEMLAAALAESPALRVVDPLRLRRTLADLGLADRPLPPTQLQQVADVLDADRVVSGRLRAAGDRIRIELALLAADQPGAAARPVVAEGNGAAELFRLVADLGAALRRELEVAAPPAAAAATAVPAALLAYGEGVDRLLRGDAVGAAPVLERAVAADPAYAAAWTRLGEAYETLGQPEKAGEAAARAVASAATGSRVAFEARAREARLAGDPERAQTILAELVEHYPNDIEARVALAEARGQQGDLEGAIAELRRVVELDPNHPRGWFLLARHTIRAGDRRRAVDDYLVRALVIQNRLGSEQGKADVLNAMGVAHQGLGELEQATQRYREAAAIRERIGDQRGFATSLRNLANLAVNKGDHAAAERDLGRALQTLEGLGDQAGIAEVHNSFGWLEESRGRNDRALERYRQALRIRRELGDNVALAQSLNNVGYAYHLLGEYDNAMVYWQQAVELQRAAGDRAGVLVTEQSIGQLQLAQGKWEPALRTFLDTLEASRELGMKEATAVSLGNLGRVAQYQGRYGAALDSYAQALAVVRELDDRRGLAEFTLYAAEALLELGLLDAAGERLAAVAQWLAEGGNDEQLAELASLRGDLARRRGDVAAARSQFATARQHAAAGQSVVALLRARTGAALAQGAAGRGELEKLARDAQRLGHAPLRLRIEEALATASLEAKDAAAAEGAARRALRLATGVGSYAGAYRLHLLAARALEARGADGESERAAARRELERLRQGLDAEQQAAFARLPEVRELAKDAVAPGA